MVRLHNAHGQPLARLVVLAMALLLWSAPLAAQDVFVEQIAPTTTAQEDQSIAASGASSPGALCASGGLDCLDDVAPSALDRLPVPPAGGNAADVRQFGSGNSAVVVMRGRENRSLSVQDGTGNSVTLNILGADNGALTEQFGNDNTLGLSIQGAGNVIQQSQAGNGNALSVEHVGDGLKMTIRQNR